MQSPSPSDSCVTPFAQTGRLGFVITVDEQGNAHVRSDLGLSRPATPEEIALWLQVMRDGELITNLTEAIVGGRDVFAFCNEAVAVKDRTVTVLNSPVQTFQSVDQADQFRPLLAGLLALTINSFRLGVRPEQFCSEGVN